MKPLRYSATSPSVSAISGFLARTASTIVANTGVLASANALAKVSGVGASLSNALMYGLALTVPWVGCSPKTCLYIALLTSLLVAANAVVDTPHFLEFLAVDGYDHFAITRE